MPATTDIFFINFSVINYIFIIEIMKTKFVVISL